MAITRFYKIISPKTPSVDVTTNQDIGGGSGLFGNYSWYNRVVQGSTNRAQKYREYDVMDADIDISNALTIIAEEMTGNNPKTDLPLQIHINAGMEQRVPTEAVATIDAALNTWCKLQDWHSRMFQLVRNLIKYGDVFFFRPKKKNKRWVYVTARQVESAIVSADDITDVKGWRIKTDVKKTEGTIGNTALQNINGNLYDGNVQVFEGQEIIRFTLNNEMSEEAPFGESILRAVFKVFKQKELLEDSIVIYRIVRAPERRVFYIDTGKMPPHKAAQYLETFKNEIRQKKIPTMQGGQNSIESVYNPTSTSEDYFFSVKDGAANSRVETLAGGQNLGNMDDVQYFYKKIWRGLRIPASYIANTTDEGSVSNDGAVGLAYIQEIKFSEYVERLQRHVELVMDREFKRFLHDAKINVDTTIFNVQLPAPTNWAKSKQNKIDAETTGVYNGIKDDGSISKRFAQEVFLQWDKERIATNERMLREEKGLDPNGGNEDLPKLYWPETAEAGGFEGGLGGSGGGGPEDFNGDLGDENAEGAENAEGNNQGAGNQAAGNDAQQGSTLQNGEPIKS